ncbi:MAG: hypothetical protein MRY83_09135 [Flavobacteriales bacterium]|nr:hypothetical protein [Flavobacteriales bacterium]
MKNILFCIAVISLFLSCDKDNHKLCGKTGTIQDNLGQDGCTIVIVDDGGDTFSPTNIYDFGVPIHQGARVRYSYQLLNNQGNCVLGISIELVCLEQE